MSRHLLYNVPKSVEKLAEGGPVFKRALEQISQAAEEGGKMLLPSEARNAAFTKTANFLTNEAKPLFTQTPGQPAGFADYMNALNTDGTAPVANAVKRLKGLEGEAIPTARIPSSSSNVSEWGLFKEAEEAERAAVNALMKPNPTVASSTTTALSRAAGVIAAREAIDGVTHAATKAVKDVPVLGELASAGEDILQVGLNPWTWLASPVYIPYRLGSAAFNIGTGKHRDELIKPYDFRPTVGGITEGISSGFSNIRDSFTNIGQRFAHIFG